MIENKYLENCRNLPIDMFLKTWQDYENLCFLEYLNILKQGNYDAISVINVFFLASYRDNLTITAGNDGFRTELSRRYNKAQAKLDKLAIEQAAKRLSKLHNETKNNGVMSHYYTMNEAVNLEIDALIDKFGRKPFRNQEDTRDILDWLESQNSNLKGNYSLLPINNTNIDVLILHDNDSVPGLTNVETSTKLFYGETVLDIDGNEVSIPQSMLIWLEVLPKEFIKADGATVDCFDRYEVNQFAMYRDKYTKEPISYGDSNGRFRITHYGMTDSPYRVAYETFEAYDLLDKLVSSEQCWSNHKYIFKSRRNLLGPNKIKYRNIGLFPLKNGRRLAFLNTTDFSQAATNIPNQVKHDMKKLKFNKFGFHNPTDIEADLIERDYKIYYAANIKETK